MKEKGLIGLHRNGESEEEVAKLTDLWAQCFHDSKEYMDYYFTQKLKDNEILTYEMDNQLVSMLHLNPYHLHVNETECESAYIVGVATKKEYRKRGIMRRLLETSLISMYEKNYPFTYLMPASEAIYYPFDFRFIYGQQRVILTRDEHFDTDFSRKETCSKDIKLRVLLYEELSINQKEDLFNWVNQKLSKDFQIYAVRSLDYYNRLALEMRAAGGDIKVYYLEDRLVGVICFMQEEWTEVAESIIDKEYTLDIIGDFLKKRDQITFLESHYLDSDRLKQLNYHLTNKDVSIIMARIVNVHALFERLRSKSDICVMIEIDDPIIAKNRGRYELKMNSVQGSLSVTKEQPEAVFTIDSLTNYLFGVVSLEDIFEKNQLSKATKEKLNQIEKLDRVYLNEIV